MRAFLDQVKTGAKFMRYGFGDTIFEKGKRYPGRKHEFRTYILDENGKRISTYPMSGWALISTKENSIKKEA